MKTEALYKSLVAIHKEWNSIFDRIEHCKESFEDFLPHNLAEYITTKNMCKDILSFIERKIPIQCNCGSFEFVEEKVTIILPHRSCSQESYTQAKGRTRYLCIKCGEEKI